MLFLVNEWSPKWLITMFLQSEEVISETHSWWITLCTTRKWDGNRRIVPEGSKVRVGETVKVIGLRVSKHHNQCNWAESHSWKKMLIKYSIYHVVNLFSLWFFFKLKFLLILKNVVKAYKNIVISRFKLFRYDFIG